MLKQIIDKLPADQKRQVMMSMLGTLSEDFADAVPDEHKGELRAQVTDLVIQLNKHSLDIAQDVQTAQKALINIEAYYESLETQAEVSPTSESVES